MAVRIDRLSFPLTSSMGLGSFALPGFIHSVASGEPSAASILLWARYVPAGRDAVKLTVEMA